MADPRPAFPPLPAGEGRGEGKRIAPGSAAPTTLVIGLGNPILGDDGVGWRVAEAVSAELYDPDVDVLCLAVGGMTLMERLAGYRRALIVDAVVSGAPPGTVHDLPADDMHRVMPHHTASSHDLSLATALDLGRELGAELPAEIRIVGVEASPAFEFGEALSAPVADAVPEALARVRAWLEGDWR
ncbi:MAG TPA: hydrogenase maturation protease [Thiobacillaceae bacterium]|nr:hydrogenase maturation protease [Thiobacillaceae bacterium]